MKIIRFFKYFFFIIACLLIIASIYIKYTFNDISFEQLIYSVVISEGFSFSAISQFILIVCIFLICFFIIIYFINKFKRNYKVNYESKLTIKFNKKKISLKIFPIPIIIRVICYILFLCFSVYFTFDYLNIFEFLDDQKETSSIFEDYYVDASDVTITFPEDKRNLIYIYVESLEVSNFTIENGGLMDVSYTPNLESLALENTNFSNSSTLGGGYATYGSTWTVAGMISQTSGVPLKLNSSFDANSYSNFGQSLPGVTSLGDILLENGYKNYLMMGSNASFGGRRDYFTYHGEYEIYDYLWAVDEGLIPSDYYVWWGYEDSKLYTNAKNKLLEIAENDEPFNFTLLTADTHFVDGYLDDSCPTPFDSHYANSYNCTDLMLYDFISWIKEQDFYDNTTIIISGDHLTMQTGFYDASDDYDRVVYNTFINSYLETDNNKNRIFSTLDMFPTTLASLGAKLSSDRLGLGTNLYSNTKTLAEELGIDYLNTELAKKSSFYNLCLLGDTYYEIEKIVEENSE